jgi:hypothetical protein
MAVDTSDVHAGTGYVVEFLNIGTTDTGVRTPINESTGLTHVTSENYF